MRVLSLAIVTAVVFAGCGSSGGGGGSGGGSGGGTSATGGLSGQAGHAGTGEAAPTGGSFGAGGTVSHSGGAGGGGRAGHGGATSGSGGAGNRGSGGAGTGGAGGSGGVAGKGGGSGGAAGTGGGVGGGNGGSGMVCGGLLARVCDADQFCHFGDGSCGAGDQTGMCEPRQVGGVLCAQVVVCGCDGKTYPSACTAHLAGMDTTPTNSCIHGNGVAGAPCGGDTDCATGFKCCMTGGAVSSSIACRQVAAGSQCPALP